MSAPYRTTYRDPIAVIEAINNTIEDWKRHQLAKQGLSNFGMFSRTSVSASREDLLTDTHIHPKKLD